MKKLIKINADDNVAVALEAIQKGYTEDGICALEDIPFGHKILLCDLKKGESVIKYGYPIGHITADLPKGSYVHEHNLKTDLADKHEYAFSGDNEYNVIPSDLTVNAYRRKNGSVGIRNELWIISTVGCVNSTVHTLESLSRDVVGDEIDGVCALTHPYGCSQMDDDQENTRRVLASLINHPNAGGVLVVSLGCENTGFETLKGYLGDYDKSRVKLLVCQDTDDELGDGLKLIEELYNGMKTDRREAVNISELKVGFKCGGSDAFSGITANALCGLVCDKLTSFGASAVLTEVPEMFGAEHLLMERSLNKEVFKKQVNMINSFKDYFASNGQVCYENPSPGNHEGGITTLEEKSLGCVQKGGKSVVCDVLNYAESCRKNGLSLLYGPGNDIVSTTNLTASGVHMVIFTTGRGTPLGAPVPTVKVSSNTPLFEKKKRWIDFNAGEALEGRELSDLADGLMKKIISFANGEKTKNELSSNREIAIFKTGVTM